MLDREGESLSLLSGAAVEEILGGYVTAADPAADPLYRFLRSVAGNGGRGGGFLVRGPHRAGKTHLLAVAALLLEYPRLRPVFIASHPGYAGLLGSLGPLDPIIVVPVPLEEHRAHDEHLEDIVFDRTETELHRPRYSLSLPLSEHSYALDLIERHVVPRYGAELDAYVAQLPGTQRSWRDLVERNPAAAVGAARGFAQEIGYPLDFRQSRVERLARLLDIVNTRHYKAIVWLVDDLGPFLAASGQKAVRNDAAFLEFLGQRSKIAPLYILGTMTMALDQTAAIEPYMLANIQDAFESLSLGSGELRRVNRQRAVAVNDPAQFETAMQAICAVYDRAHGQRSFTLEELANSYPLHPLALSCLEAIYARYLSEGDALADFLQSLAASGSRGAYLDRAQHQLLGLGEVLVHLTSRLSAHPQAAAYLREAVDYYERSGPGLFPEDPELPVQLARQLVVLRLANMTVPVSRLVEDLGCTPEGTPRVTEARAREALEQMRLRGRFVDLRRGATAVADTYVIDVEANFTELARRHLLAYKAALADDDSRLWEVATSVLSSAALPLADLSEPVSLQVEWVHTPRRVLVQAGSLIGLSAERLAARASELSEGATVEDLRLHIADLGRVAEQKTAWREACTGLPRGRWAASVLAWLPRALTPEELDRIKELAACRALLQDTSPRQDAKLNDRLAEEATRLATEVRTLVENAYVEGEVVSGEGPLLGPGELARSRKDWPATLAAIAGAALPRVYPALAANPPRAPLQPRDTVDVLISGVLGAHERAWDHEGPLGELSASLLQPLGLVQRRGDKWHLVPDQSPVADELIQRVRRRDQTPETEPGRPISFLELGRYLAKSPWGLPEELFELTVAALVRDGMLLPMNAEGEVLPRHALRAPLSGQVSLLSRAPLLSNASWQDLTRLTRILLERMVPRADHALQTELWEALVAARAAQSAELARLMKVLGALCERLGQPGGAWPETLRALDTLQAVWDAVDPESYPAAGLQHVLEVVSPHLTGTPSPLSLALRHKLALEAFLERTAPEVVAMADYLQSEELAIGADTDLVQRREQLLSLIMGGERLLAEETTFRRLVQIFLSVYKRRYVAWHTRCYRASVFDKYRALRGAPEFRVLANLQRLEFRSAAPGSRAMDVLEAQEARRCTYAGLGEALDRSPVCPQCHLKLDEELDLVPVEEIRQLAEQEVAAYAAHLTRPGFQRALREYALALPGRGDLAARLGQLLEIGEAPTSRALLAILNDDVITHLNRVLSGKTIRPRNFSELRNALAGRTLSKDEAQRLFQKWLEGGEGSEGDEGDEMLHVEP